MRMRGIKFRGRRLDTGEWVYGKLLNSNFSSFIVIMVNTIGGNVISSIAYHEISQESTGQYTGLKDKNGVEIFEGDVVKEKFEDEYDIGNVIFKDGAFWVEFKPDEELLLGCDSEETEIIGNIYEHPELLGDSN